MSTSGSTRRILGAAILATTVAACADTTPTGLTSEALWTPSLALVTTPEAQDLGTLGGPCSARAYDINNSNKAVGTSCPATGPEQAFTWENGSMTSIGVPGFPSTAYAINDQGQIVGRSMRTAAPFEIRATLWDGGSTTYLGTLPGDNFSEAWDINENGVVVGVSGVQPLGPFRAFRWEAGVMTDLGLLGTDIFARSINDAGVIVGSYFSSGTNLRAFSWENGVLTDLGPGGRATAWDINESGVIAGTHVWDGASTSPVPPFNASGEEASAINAAGEMAGSGHDPTGSYRRALFWEGGDVTELPGLPGFVNAWAHGMNDNGYVVGESHDGTESRPVLWRVIFTAEELVDQLLEDVLEIADSGTDVADLISKLENALDKIDKDNTEAAINQIESFLHKLEKAYTDGEVTQEQYESLKQIAEDAIAALETETA